MCVDGLAVVLPISAIRHKPHRVTLADLPPVARHVHVHTTIEDGDALVSRRGIRDAPARRIVRIVAGLRIVASLLTNRITLPAALNLSHRRSGSITTESLLNTSK